MLVLSRSQCSLARSMKRPCALLHFLFEIIATVVSEDIDLDLDGSSWADLCDIVCSPTRRANVKVGDTTARMIRQQLSDRHILPQLPKQLTACLCSVPMARASDARRG